MQRVRTTKIKFSGKAWKYKGKAAWHFITLSKKVSKQIKTFSGNACSAWGSVKVQVKVGKTKWNTSVFPDTKLGAYLLPLKLEIRKREKIIEKQDLTGELCISYEEGFLSG